MRIIVGMLAVTGPPVGRPQPLQHVGDALAAPDRLGDVALDLAHHIIALVSGGATQSVAEAGEIAFDQRIIHRYHSAPLDK
jgi:hypothetical protein